MPRAVRTYLEMTDPADLDGAPAPSGDVDRRAGGAVPARRSGGISTPRSAAPITGWIVWGGPTTRSPRYLADPALEFWVLRVAGERAGYFELRDASRWRGRGRLLRAAARVHRPGARQVHADAARSSARGRAAPRASGCTHLPWITRRRSRTISRAASGSGSRKPTTCSGKRLASRARGMHRFLVAAALSTVAGAAGFAGSGSFSDLPPSLSGINASAPRYTTEDERLVSEIAGSILNIAAFADHFETGDAFQVRNVGATPRSAKFSLARRAEVFTVEVPAHVWMPAELRRAGAQLHGGRRRPEHQRGRRPRTARTVDGARRRRRRDGQAQNVRLSRLLAEHPRSAALHERAALLLARRCEGSSRPVIGHRSCAA